MNRLFSALNRKNTLISSNPNEKVEAEVAFWEQEIENYKRWYKGELREHYGQKAPRKSKKVEAENLKDSAILTWFDLHQKPKYLADLKLSSSAFNDMRLLDIGAGPMPSAEAFRSAWIYALDPLYSQYTNAGFPLHYYDRTRFVNAYSESIPIPRDYFDAVISVNAIDHVNDFQLTAKEIRRVLKPNGLFAMHVHYHQPTTTEPLVLNDKVFTKEFNWVKGLKKIGSSQQKYGSKASRGESFVLWRNF